MSKLILGGGDNDEQAPAGARLPPLRKFVVRRVSYDPLCDLPNGIEEIIGMGHGLELFGTAGLAIVEYRMVGAQIMQTYPRIFNDWRDVEELVTDSLKIN